MTSKNRSSLFRKYRVLLDPDFELKEKPFSHEAHGVHNPSRGYQTVSLPPSVIRVTVLCDFHHRFMVGIYLKILGATSLTNRACALG